MSKKIEFRIQKPCHENWEKMEIVERGKFCVACQQTVVDFSLMTDFEVLLHISKANGNICGRFAPEQLDREINISEQKKGLSWKYAWNILLAIFLTSTEASAQTKPTPNKVKLINRLPGSQYEIKEKIDPVQEIEGLSVTIIDEEDKTPLVGASITMPGKKQGFTTDLNGNFNIGQVIEKRDTLIISSVGYESITTTIDEIIKAKEFPFLKLQLHRELMGEVVVIGYESKDLNWIAGGVSIKYKDTIFRKWQDTLASAFTRNPLSIFPNPVLKGNFIHLQFSVKEQGDYGLQIINTNGQIIKQQTINIQSKNMVKQLFIDKHYTKGIYFVRIENCWDKKSYQNKFIVR